MANSPYKVADGSHYIFELPLSSNKHLLKESNEDLAVSR